MPCIAVVAPSVQRPPRAATTPCRTSSQASSESTSTPSRSNTIAAGSIRPSSTVPDVELAKASAVEPLGDGGYGAALDPGWAIGNKLNGGDLLAILAPAAGGGAAAGAGAGPPGPGGRGGA